ncbi:MAG: homoserine kinase [Elainellaceae cyanobacterium]
MATLSSVHVTVPATTANIGPGFDCLGAALTLYNRFRFSLLPGSESLTIEASGSDAAGVATDASNLAYRAFSEVYHRTGKSVPAVKIGIELGVPLARGLGSSATAIIGGLVGANALLGSPLCPTEVMQLAIAIEGHPDNVVPALLGGCQLTVASDQNQPIICAIPWQDDISPILAVPNFELSTSAARRVLPDHYSRADAIFNTAHLGLLIRGLEAGHVEWLRAALHDRIHQPYRYTLIPGYSAVYEAALSAGAYGLVISGAGPTLLVLAHSDQGTAIEMAIAQTWANYDVRAQFYHLKLDTQGAVIK